MELSLYNSLTRSKEQFIPIDPENIKMYVCGPTVYDFAHIGNARAMVAFDILYRVLKHKYKNVIFVRNITDIDDKIYTASIKQNCKFSDIAKKFDAEFQKDMRSLNVLEPTYQPHATDFIPQIINMISILIQKGFAYETNEHVLFSVEKYADYGQLSRKDKDELIAGARVEVAPYKQSPGDFVLWKPSTEEMPGWQSPWGRGRPGWHIECSAMSAHYLGKTFDIHTGGIDLIFPHHENERAQSCCAWGVSKMANFWMHNGHLMVEGKKMSKSLGNFFTIRELIQKYNPEAIRLAFLLTHYRQPLDWTTNSIEMAKQILSKWYRVIEKFEKHDFFSKKEVFYSFLEERMEKIELLSNDFFKALCDDLNTPAALQALAKKVKTLEDSMEDIDLAVVLFCREAVGLLKQSARSWFQYSAIGIETLSDEEIERKLKTRQQAKEQRNFKLADEIREELLANGVQIEDSVEGPRWRRG
jgi:cysteinyl-tRNA synthetase